MSRFTYSERFLNSSDKDMAEWFHSRTTPGRGNYSFLTITDTHTGREFPFSCTGSFMVGHHFSRSSNRAWFLPIIPEEFLSDDIKDSVRDAMPGYGEEGGKYTKIDNFLKELYTSVGTSAFGDGDFPPLYSTEDMLKVMCAVRDVANRGNIEKQSKTRKIGNYKITRR